MFCVCAFELLDSIMAPNSHWFKWLDCLSFSLSFIMALNSKMRIKIPSFEMNDDETKRNESIYISQKSITWHKHDRNLLRPYESVACEVASGNSWISGVFYHQRFSKSIFSWKISWIQQMYLWTCARQKWPILNRWYFPFRLHKIKIFIFWIFKCIYDVDFFRLRPICCMTICAVMVYFEKYHFLSDIFNSCQQWNERRVCFCV